MTETILDESAVSEIEARSTRFHNPRETNASRMAEALALIDHDIPSLCATVKHLRAEAKSKKIELLQLSGRGDLLAKEHVKFESLDEVAAVRNEFDRLRNIVIVDLQSQLEQLRAERDALRDSASIVAFQAHQIDGKIAESLIGQGGKDFRLRAIQLCKDKAAEWADGGERWHKRSQGESGPFKAQSESDRDACFHKSAAARTLATELEKL